MAAALTVGVLAAALLVGWSAHLIITNTAASHPREPAPQFAGPVFASHFRAPGFSLSDQHGRPATLSQYQGLVIVLTFMYSHSRDTGPLMATEIRGALDELPDGGRGVPVLAISVDPAHDTRASARAFLAREQMTDRMQFLLGSRRELEPIWKRYGIQPEFDPSGRRYSSGYSAYVMLIDRRGFLRVGIPIEQLVPEDLAHDLRLLLDERQ